MRSNGVIPSIVSVLISGCSAAHSATTPDSQNPAHCIAAFNYGAYWFRLDHNDRRVRNMYVRAAYEMEKLKAKGESATGALADGKVLTERYARDQDAMDRLFKACGDAQDADPKFREVQPRLIAQLSATGAI
ncbi:MAG TPA: hypothetical protein VE989_00460 [Sphingomicrobium sp.]|jgi:hypothetical protein|nr:hypothetical protein [Sphingomicrobium sp.]